MLLFTAGLAPRRSVVGANAQLMAAKGWLVFQPNYRGSETRQRVSTRSQRRRGGPGRDVMADRGGQVARIVDESRMAVSGWSYGGYMTTWMLGTIHVWRRR